LPAKIRDGAVAENSYMLVVGGKEAEAGPPLSAIARKVISAQASGRSVIHFAKSRFKGNNLKRLPALTPL